MKQFKERNMKGINDQGIVNVMVKELVIRKNKLEKLEKAKVNWSLFTLMCLAIFLLFGYQLIIGQNGSFGNSILTEFTKSPFLFVLLLLFTISFIEIHFFEKKATKAENEFEALRMELIERNTELWPNDESWEVRDRLYSYMKDKHNINLYYK
ncbi:DUF2663 family protein [Halalkalibacter nanhaiisediminis]|uniref:Uncharacterized protein DUF2663 n=1 Tax=Halalkalibacter nanhaiisediminis TaxID=688079 RepID=A0A562QEK8_9BACI|nr:DUF2663 family protein [Halalkalibacter nanhaiisediminis]TWI54610.1 uncharacterized protein DUF2663 [Halalkalibacter nanhaiisediminis]